MDLSQEALEVLWRL